MTYIRKKTFTFVRKVKKKYVEGKILTVTIGQENKQKIYEYILKNARPNRGIHQHEIIKNIDIEPNPTRQTVYNHIRQLIKEAKIYKKRGQYFPENWLLNAISFFARDIREHVVQFIDPFFVEHKYKSHKAKPAPNDLLTSRVSGISVSNKYCKASFSGSADIREKYLFEYVNRVGFFITYIFIESMRPRETNDISDETRQHMSKSMIFDSINLANLFQRFCLFVGHERLLNNDNIKYKFGVSLDSNKKTISPVELNKTDFDNLVKAFRNLYPGIYDGIEESWFASREKWCEIDRSIITGSHCTHEWQDFYIYKYKKSYCCNKCGYIVDSTDGLTSA
jgi:hypothetical protein